MVTDRRVHARLIGKRIKSLQIQHDINQQKLTNETNIPQHRLSRISNGKAIPILAELAALAKPLQTTVDALNKPDPDVASATGSEHDPRDAYTNPDLPLLPTTQKRKFASAKIDMSVNADIIKGFKRNSKRALEINRCCGRFLAYSPTVDWMIGGAAPFKAELRTVDIRIFSPKGTDRYFFELGKEKYRRRKASIYYYGEVLASSDRIFLIGYDVIEHLDWIFLTLVMGEDSHLVGMQTLSIYRTFGARRVALVRTRTNGKPRRIPARLASFLTESETMRGVLVTMTDEKRS